MPRNGQVRPIGKILARPDHPLAAKQELSVSDLTNAKWLAHPTGRLLKEQMDFCLLGLGVSSINTAFRVGSCSLVKKDHDQHRRPVGFCSNSPLQRFLWRMSRMMRPR